MIAASQARRSPIEWLDRQRAFTIIAIAKVDCISILAIDTAMIIGDCKHTIVKARFHLSRNDFAKQLSEQKFRRNWFGILGSHHFALSNEPSGNQPLRSSAMICKLGSRCTKIKLTKDLLHERLLRTVI